MATSVYTSLLLKDYKRKASEIMALCKDLRETPWFSIGLTPYYDAIT